MSQSPFIEHLMSDPQMCIKLLEALPIACNITDGQGYLVYGNPKFLEGTLDSAKEEARGQYNILAEPQLEAWGLKEHIEKAFAGETVVTKQLEHPSREMINTRYTGAVATRTLSQDVYSYPIKDEFGSLVYIVTLFVPISTYCEREEIKKGRQYICEHWEHSYDVHSAASASGLSVSRFNTCFKAELGITPHQYYQQVKLEHLKEFLLNPNHSVSEAFSRAGIDYNHHYVHWFKGETGMTPRQFKIHKPVINDSKTTYKDNY